MGNCWSYLRSLCCGILDGGLIQQEEVEDNESESSEEVAWWEQHDPVINMEIDNELNEDDFVDFEYDDNFVQHLLDLMVRDEQSNDEVRNCLFFYHKFSVNIFLQERPY